MSDNYRFIILTFILSVEVFGAFYILPPSIVKAEEIGLSNMWLEEDFSFLVRDHDLLSLDMDEIKKPLIAISQFSVSDDVNNINKSGSEFGSGFVKFNILHQGDIVGVGFVNQLNTGLVSEEGADSRPGKSRDDGGNNCSTLSGHDESPWWFVYMWLALILAAMWAGNAFAEKYLYPIAGAQLEARRLETQRPG